MNYERAYGSFEEFQREEIRPHERLEMSFEEILADFDTDDAFSKRRQGREGLFDAYEDEDEEIDDYDA